MERKRTWEHTINVLWNDFSRKTSSSSLIGILPLAAKIGEGGGTYWRAIRLGLYEARECTTLNISLRSKLPSASVSIDGLTFSLGIPLKHDILLYSHYLSALSTGPRD
jgi:hypothetical protein